MRFLAVLSLLALSACGADGNPTAPDGISLTGEAEMGVARDGG